jgi:hypothetical protein
VSQHGHEALARMRRGMLEALPHIGEDLLGFAVRDAPLKEGFLRGSGDVAIEDDGNTAAAVVSFNVPYAEAQETHEEYHHPRAGKAHYLGDNLAANGNRYLDIMGRAAQLALRV